MRRFLPFRQTIIFVTLFFLCNGQSQTCSISNRIYECQATSSSSTVNLTSLPQGSTYDSISIKYSGSVVLDLTSTSVKPIVIAPLDENDHTLRISRINTNASSIQIKIRLSSGQVAVSLFSDLSSIIAPTATVIVNVAQTISNVDQFKLIAPTSTTTMNFANFELIVNATNSDIGNLYLHNLIFGLTNLLSVSISGSNHELIVDQASMPQSNNINQLSLKRLRLHNQILFYFKNLTAYSIEQCIFNKTSSFLNATQTAVNVELEMKNNIPTDGILPYRSQAFLSLGTLKSLTLIEPQLDSTVLNAIKGTLNPATVIISLNSYQKSDIDSLADEKLSVNYLTIKNIATLNVFRDVFFNNFHRLKQVTLQGNFVVEKTAIRAFVGINKGSRSEYPIVTLTTTQTSFDVCTRMYITGINIESVSDVPCASDPTCQTCQRWYDDTVKCDLIAYEKPYISLITEKLSENYYYYDSTLYYYFQNLSCLNKETTQRPPEKEKVNIGAIIGALCGLIIAALILGLTVYCICRRRNQYPSETNEPSAPQFKKIRSSSDPSNVSIATSKTSKSSRYALEKSFFPAIQPNDEIAPPLYTAPSESVASTSNYHLPSAPAAPRDSISTHATTHFYETVDP